MSRDGGDIQVLFQPVPTPMYRQIYLLSMLLRQKRKPETSEMTEGIDQEERPKFGPRPRFNSKKFDFNKELARLPFPVNFGEVELSPSQQK